MKGARCNKARDRLIDRGPHTGPSNVSNDYAENELPQPQPPVEFGFLKVKPDPCIDDT